MKTALIDGDILVYRMAFATQKNVWTHTRSGQFFEGVKKAKDWFKEENGFNPNIHKPKEWMDKYWDESEWTSELQVEPFNHCSYLIDMAMNTIVKKTGADTATVYLSDKSCFRNDIAVTKEYKAGRPPPPVHKDKARDYLLNLYGAEIGDNLEADDMLGLNQTESTVICSIDKDLLQIPGRHYDIVNETSHMVDPYEADCWFMCQVISGDATDNIPGIPGMGDAKAAKLVDAYAGDHEGLVECIKGMYEEHYPYDPEGVLREMAQLVYILRKGDVLGENEQWRNLLNLED